MEFDNSTLSNEQKRLMATMVWPPYSPDLNIIENVWAIIKDRVYKNSRRFKTESEIKEVIEFHWNDLKNDESLFNSLYLSLIRRVKDCIAAEGAHF